MNAVKRIVKSVIAIGFLSVAFASQGGNTCTWTGRGADNKWGTSENWDTPPVSGNGDTLVLRSSGTSENETEGFEVGKIITDGTGTATINGKQIVFMTGAAHSTLLLSNNVPLVVNAPIALKDGVKGFFQSEVTDATMDFNGKVTLGEDALLKLGRAGQDNGVFAKITFNAPIDGPNATIVTAHGRNGAPSGQPGIWFNKVVTLKYLSVCNGTAGNIVHLCASGNSWTGASVQFANIMANAENAFSTTGVLGWRNKTYSGGVDVSNNYIPGNDTQSCYDLNGYNQTIDRIDVAAHAHNWGTPVEGYAVGSTDPATLTMKATGDATSYARICGKVSLVWDPQDDDYALTFVDRVNKTEGDIEVRRGTVKVTTTATFAKVGKIVVREKAAFRLLSTAANALANLEKLTLYSGATFEVAATATTPFGTADGPKLQMMSDGTALVVPEGMTLNVSELMLDGERIYGKTYKTGDEGCDWLTGGGSLMVAAEGPHEGYSWRNARDGDWSTAANWLSGVVPGETDAAEVTVPYEGNYVAKIDGGFAYNGDLTVANDLGGTATVEVVSGTWTRGGTKLELAKGGEIAVDTGAALMFSGNYSGVDVNGGRLAVKNGGTVTMTAIPGDSTIVRNGGVVRVEAGGYLAYRGYNENSDSLRYFDVGADGRLEIAGCGYFRNYAYWGHGLYTSGGDIEVMGTGVLDVRVNSQGGIFGNGTVTLKDSSTFYLTNEYARAQIPASILRTHEETTITFEDHAKLNATSYLLLGNNRRAKAEDPRNAATLNFNSDATSAVGMIYLGVPNGVGIINIANGTVNETANIHAGSCLASSTDCSADYMWAAYTWKPEGHINVTGGSLSVRGSSYDIMSSGANKELYGLVLGNGVSMPVANPTYAAGYDAKGSLNLSGGSVTLQQWAALVVGGGFGSGAIDQTGGALMSQSASYGAIIGFLGGTGSYTMGGGTATLAGNLYVGGATKTELGWNSLSTTGRIYTEAAIVDCDVRNAANGTLTVTGGTMTVAKDIIVSADGTGTVNVGEGGTLSAKNITLNANSAVNYKLGPTGSGLVKTAGTLTVAPGTKLTIDASAYEGDKGVKLMEFAAIDGAFDIQPLVQPKVGGRRIVVTPTGIRMSSGRGAMLIVR